MSINIVSRSQKFYNQFKNGVTFTDNLTDYTNNLAGSVGEKIKYIQQIDVSWDSSYTVSNRWFNDSVNLSVKRDSGSWYLEGFNVGDVCDWFQNGVFFGELTITAISNDGSTFYYTINSGTVVDGSQAELKGKTPLTASTYKFGLIGNSESFNIESKVSENDQGYYGSNIGFDTGGGVRDTNFVQLTRLGQYADWETGTMQIRFVSNPSTYVQRFEIEHEFIITPFYLDGELNNLQNNIIPNLLNGTNSLKYVFNPGFSSVLSNPNTEKSIRVDNNLGSVAWFNENFNGFQNNYTIKNVTYEDYLTTASADGLLIGSKTRVQITVGGSFSGAERFGAFISYLPQQIEYQDTLTTLKENFLFDNGFNSAGLTPVPGTDFITEIQSVVFSGDLIITMGVEYSPTQKAFLSNKLGQQPTYFMIGIEVGDVTLPNGNSDRVTLLADVEVYDESADIPDLMDVTKLDIYAHNKQIGVDAGSTDITGWIEDGVAVDFAFNLDLNKKSFINTLDFKLIAFNTVTQQYFELDSFAYNNIGNAIVSGGVQQLNETTTRGYVLQALSQFNNVEISTGANYGGIQTYNGRFSQKISWQDWIKNLNVDSIFYDVSKPNDNLNDKASNYSLLNDYEIRLSIYANLDGENQFGVAGNTNYLFNSPTLPIFDYQKDGNITPIWSESIETFNAANNSNLNGSILTGQDTLFRSTWTNSGGAVTSLSGLWGINRIEETGQLGFAITEMSSINDPAANQLLIPSSGTKLFVYLNAGKVVFECLINGQGKDYNLSTRIQDESVVVVDGKITELGVLKDTEAGIQKIIE